MDSSRTPAPADKDSRTDEQILADLQVFKPVDPASEKNVWAFWDKGLTRCPGWCQRNIISWVRRLGPQWTVRVLDHVDGSPVHYSRYIANGAAVFPEAFLREGGLQGRAGAGAGAGPGMLDAAAPHVAQHSSDLIRLPLLYLYGGVWLDVGFLLFRSLDSLFWDVLGNEQDPREMAGFAVAMGPGVGMIFNGLIAARRGCRCIRLWHETFVAAWRAGDGGTDGDGDGGVIPTTTTGMSRGRLLRHLPRYEPPSRNGAMPPFRYEQFVDYIAQVFCLERLRHLMTDPASGGDEDEGGWNGPAYFAERVLLYDCISQVYWAQRLTNWDGRRQFELLARRRQQQEQQRDQSGSNEDNYGTFTQTPEYKEADDFVSGILAVSSTMKISHGLASAGREYLADLWDSPKHSDADRAPGTFAAHLRWASEHFEQTRPLEPTQLPVRKEALLVGGVLTAEGGPRAE